MAAGPNHIRVLGVEIDDIAPAQLLDRLLGDLGTEAPQALSTINTEILLWTRSDQRCAAAIQATRWHICDAVGVQWAAAFQRWRLPPLLKVIVVPFSLIRLLIQPASAQRVLRHRYAGRQLFLDLLVRAAQERRRVFFLGGGPGIAEQTAAKARRNYPGLAVVGSYAGDAQLPEEILSHLVPTDILFVAFSHPWQEYFVTEQLNRLPAKLVIGVGGTYDYYLGAKPLGSPFRQVPPPAWAGRLGLEWAWRLITQPNRFARIMRAVWLFAYAVATTPPGA